jgi:uncharacterized protein YutE (UPF0331/DUF86 family)
VVLRVETLQKRLSKLEQVISGLRELEARDRATLRESYFEMLALERLLELGAIIIFDIGNHILSAEHGLAADDYDGILTQLVTHHVISEPLRSRLKGLAGFRNLLAHAYRDIDSERVLDLLPRAPQDFTDFAREIQVWLDARECP